MGVKEAEEAGRVGLLKLRLPPSVRLACAACSDAARGQSRRGARTRSRQPQPLNEQAAKGERRENGTSSTSSQPRYELI